jgi:hypothetical protein
VNARSYRCAANAFLRIRAPCESFFGKSFLGNEVKAPAGSI